MADPFEDEFISFQCLEMHATWQCWVHALSKSFSDGELSRQYFEFCVIL